MATVTYRLKNGQTLSVVRNDYDITPATEADPAWVFTDKKGHVHTWTSRTWIHYEPDEDVDDWTPYYYCSLCGEHVHPQTRAAQRQFIYSPTLYLLDGESIPKEQAESRLA